MVLLVEVAEGVSSLTREGESKCGLNAAGRAFFMYPIEFATLCDAPQSPPRHEIMATNPSRLAQLACEPVWIPT